MKLSFLSLLIAAAMSLVGCRDEQGGNDAELVLAQGGVALYDVAVPDDSCPGNAFAIADLTNLLFRSTGAEFSVVKRSDATQRKRIFVGIAPESVSAMEDGEYAAQTFGGDIYLYGGGAHGTRYAVYEFLENTVGFRFFDLRGGMRVPDGTSRLVVKPPRLRRKYDFSIHSLISWRHFYRPVSTLALYRNGQDFRMHKMLSQAGILVPQDDYRPFWPSDATLPHYLPRKASDSKIEWIAALGDNLEKDHPEYFSMDSQGKRIFNHQRCLSNPEVRRILTQRVLETIRRNPGYTHFDISAGDTPGAFCCCEPCRALERKYDSPSGPLVDFLLEFCPQAAARFPHVRIVTLVYRKAQSQKPPKGIERMPDNFTAHFAPIDDNFARDWNDPDNAETYADLKEWGRLSKEVQLWYYPNTYSGELTPPLGNVGRLARDMRLAKAAGVTGQTHEHNVGTAPMTGFTELQNFVALHLFKDVECNWRALADEYIDYAYGAAAEKMRAYWLELEHLTETEKINLTWNAPLAAYRYLTPERLVRWDGEFDAMERMLADDAVRLFNVRRVRINLDLVILRKFAAVKKAFPRFSISIDVLAGRIRETANKIANELFLVGREEGQKIVKQLEEIIFSATLCNRPNAKPLPKELFGNIDSSRIHALIPRVRGTSFEDDSQAAFGCAAVMTRPIEKIKLPVKANFHDRAAKKYHWNIGCVKAEDLGPRGAYRFYRLGTVTLSPDCVLVIGNDSWYDLLTDLSSVWEFGSFNKVDIWASLKCEGPAFYSEDAGKPNRVLCDRVIAVRHAQ